MIGMFNCSKRHVERSQHVTDWTLVQDDPKLSDESGKGPKVYEAADSLIPDREILSLCLTKLAKWSNTSCVSKKKKRKK